MIPKIIHYCWLSGEPYPRKIKKFMASWRKNLPDWEFRLWDRSSLPEASPDWVKEACEAGKWAFAADYVRLYAVHKHGGFYLDTDVEVLKDLTPLTALPYALCLESDSGDIEAAAFGAEPGDPRIGKALEFYSGRHFNKKAAIQGTSLLAPAIIKAAVSPTIVISSPEEFRDGVQETQVLPPTFLSPKSYLHKDLRNLSGDTYVIHHFRSAWMPLRKKMSWAIRRILPAGLSEALFRVAASVNKLLHPGHDGDKSE